jgi:uncharacterized protein (TIGR03083 family)
MNHLEAIRHESDRFYAIADGSDPGLDVPSCPGWNIADLVWHLGEVHCFFSIDIELRATDPESIEAAKPPRPSDYRELISWGRSQADRLLQLLDTTPDREKVWTWALNESDHNVGFIRRHQVQEAAIHRRDLQQAAGQPLDPIEPVAASDSVDEFMAISLPWCVRADKPLAGTVHLHCTDTEGEWFIHPDGRVERTHAKGDVAIRGTASDLLLALYQRVPIDALELIGDTTLAQQLIDQVNLG